MYCSSIIDFRLGQLEPPTTLIRLLKYVMHLKIIIGLHFEIQFVFRISFNLSFRGGLTFNCICTTLNFMVSLYLASLQDFVFGIYIFFILFNPAKPSSTYSSSFGRDYQSMPQLSMLLAISQ